MQIINDTQLDYSDVLIVPQTTTINHRGEVEVIRDFKQLPGFRCCPIMNANMTQTGTFEVAKALIFEGMIGCIHKFYTAEQICDFLDKEPECKFHKEFFITIGLRNQAEEVLKLRACKKYKEWSILIDVPNAYIPEVEDFVKHIRDEFPNRIIAVGNVCTSDRTQELIKAGANIVKVGIGPSAVCRTRHTTGCGRPQLSAVIECANAAHQVGGLIIADGGFTMPGDLCKAFVAGADICMSGCMFAGCDEAAGEVIYKMYRTNEYTYDNEPEDESNYVNPDKPIYEMKKFKEYYGMSSFRAQKENYGKKTTTGTSEGVESKLVPYTGPILDTINNIKGALRSCGSYIGAKSIKTFSRQGSFYRVNRVQ
jgi:GMP reductase